MCRKRNTGLPLERAREASSRPFPRIGHQYGCWEPADYNFTYHEILAKRLNAKQINDVIQILYVSKNIMMHLLMSNSLLQLKLEHNGINIKI